MSEDADDLMATVEYYRTALQRLQRIAGEHCWQEEQLAHAEWHHGGGKTRFADLDMPKDTPWRGIMRTSVLRLIEDLEGEGAYDAAPLHAATAQARKPKVYQYSPYDYDIARRVEAEKAEDLWSKGDA